MGLTKSTHIYDTYVAYTTFVLTIIKKCVLGVKMVENLVVIGAAIK